MRRAMKLIELANSWFNCGAARVGGMLVLALLATGAKTSAARAQGLIGNGGDGIDCHGTTRSELSGFFVLDYVATFDRGTDNSDIYAGNDPLRRIAAKLVDIPQFGSNFAAFIEAANAQLLHGASQTGPYQWHADDLVENRIADANLITKLPPECTTADGSSLAAKISQLVVRQFRQSYTLHSYDKTLMPKITANEAQYAWLIVHEFLWNYASNAAIIRDANRFLQSSAIDTLSPAQLQIALTQRGINLNFKSENHYKTVTVTADTATHLQLDPQELVFYWPNFLTANHVKIVNQTDTLLKYQDYFTESHLPICTPFFIGPGETATVSADVIKSQYFWVARNTGEELHTCPPVRERTYVYVRESVTPVSNDDNH